VDEVKRCLEQGADPNFDSYEGQSPKQRKGQPYTPLRMVVFCISDCDLNDDGLCDFAAIAKLLIQHGAKTKPAMDLPELRYGKYNPAGERNLFLQVLDEIAVADMHSGA
jgi:hypothetical protein